MGATQLYRNRIAVVLDFDLTLAADSFSTLLRHCGVDEPETWRRRHVQPLVEDGWEHILARVYSLVCLSRSAEGPRITRRVVLDAGRSIVPYDGVPEMFGRLRDVAAEATPELEVEFHLVTSGFADMHRAVSFASEFATIRGTEFHWDGEDEIAFARRIVTHPEKAGYIQALSKGLPLDGPDGSENVHQHVSEEQMHLPLNQVIYVGDGGSDMAVFGLLHGQGGIALAVHKAESAQDWRGQQEIRAGQRVHNLAPADFRPGAELMRSLTLAVQCIAKRIELRGLGRGE